MKQFDYNIEKKSDKGSETLEVTLTGSLTLQSAKEIKSKLTDITNNFENLVINARGITGIDISFIQIIESYRRSIIRDAGKSVKIIMDLPYDMKQLLANAGITYPGK